ncbi:MAG: xanthine dehydrogenase molybdenum-binding subunit XdhA, partial [Clostridia bacterium]|nr:xanthine dehydrogenase molybdenum-binding subunit XdhA [Clostridia bacterium]
MGVGESLKRVDALEKVTGGAKYVGDLEPSGALVARIVRSTIANGLVKHIDLSEALRTPGVVKIVTCFDVPEIDFPTPGHPWSVEPAHQDVRDRRLLNTRVRFYGDEIAAVIAENGIAAERAARLVKVEYEEYEPYVTVHQAMAEDARAIHEEKPNNVLAHSHYAVGEVGFDEAAKESGLVRMEETYQTQIVQHCHLEPVHSYAYMEKGRVVVVSATQIPHIVRRVIGQALGIPLGKVRVVKPYIGGGFGNRQDVLTEPLNAYLSMQVGGRPVKLELTREETFTCSRVRHPIEFRVSALARRDGTLVARKVEAFSGQGGYASHGHSIVANAVTMFKWLYHDEKAVEGDAWTVYTNLAVGGAMRGYGIPQADFATEAMADDLARKLGVDPLDFRLQNGIREGYVDPHTGIPFLSYGLRDCLLRGREAFRWDEKRAQYHNQQGPVRRGVGMAMFCYKTGVHPISLETAGCRMTLNQDGSVMIQMGATEIGQGADTVFTQMAAQALGITEDRIYLESTQDTDISPFDTGAYASRQTYVGGMAVREAAEELKKKILDYAAYMLGCQSSALDLVNNQVVPKDDGFP